jgi:ArsR family transcriptional regulator, arsenate/arsenite/antimonite-responsive transcriptional repressor
MAKKDLFDVELQSAAALFKALGHPARLAILKYLAECKTCISGDISEELPLGRTTVNQHLKELKELGVIRGEVEGVKVNYCLDEPRLKEMKKAMMAFLDRIGNCKCCECE